MSKAIICYIEDYSFYFFFFSSLFTPYWNFFLSFTHKINKSISSQFFLYLSSSFINDESLFCNGNAITSLWFTLLHCMPIISFTCFPAPFSMYFLWISIKCHKWKEIIFCFAASRQNNCHCQSGFNLYFRLIMVLGVSMCKNNSNRQTLNKSNGKAWCFMVMVDQRQNEDDFDDETWRNLMISADIGTRTQHC